MFYNLKYIIYNYKKIIFREVYIFNKRIYNYAFFINKVNIKENLSLNFRESALS